jgi:carboxylesterase
MTNEFLQNPHLNGQAFDLPGSSQNGVLLFHGFTATCVEVSRLGQILNRIGYTAVGPLLPGHGTRPEDLNHTRWQDWVTTAEIAYQDLRGRCKRVFVGGESNGALLALYMASQHPEISGVLVYAPALRPQITPLQIIALHLAAPFIASLPKGDLNGNTTWQGYKVNPLKGVLQLRAFAKVVRGRLRLVNQPILIVQGKKDLTVYPAGAQELYNRVGSRMKELHWMENSGHCVLLEKEQHLIHRLTMDFLSKVKA